MNTYKTLCLKIIKSFAFNILLIHTLSASYQQFSDYRTIARGIDSLIQRCNKNVGYTIILNNIVPFLYCDHTDLLERAHIGGWIKTDNTTDRRHYMHAVIAQLNAHGFLYTFKLLRGVPETELLLKKFYDNNIYHEEYYSQLKGFYTSFLQKDYSSLNNLYKKYEIFSAICCNAYAGKGLMGMSYDNTNYNNPLMPVLVTPQQLEMNAKEGISYYYHPHIICLHQKQMIDSKKESFSLRLNNLIVTYRLSCIVTLPDNFDTDITQNPALFIPNNLHTAFKKFTKVGEHLLLNAAHVGAPPVEDRIMTLFYKTSTIHIAHPTPTQPSPIVLSKEQSSSECTVM